MVITNMVSSYGHHSGPCKKELNRWKSRNGVKFYNQRGTAEQCIQEGK